MASVDKPANVSENVNCSGVADFSEQISSAVKVMKSTLESVFGSGKSCQAELTLGSLMSAELYRRRNMPIWTRWFGQQATAHYKQYLAKFGDDGLGAIGRCRDMFVRLGEECRVSKIGNRELAAAMIPIGGIWAYFSSGTETKIDVERLDQLSWAVERVMDSLFKSMSDVLFVNRTQTLRDAVSEKLEALRMRDRGMVEQAELKMCTADFNLRKTYKDDETVKQATACINQLVDDIREIVAKVDLDDYKALLRIVSVDSHGLVTCAVKKDVSDRFPRAVEAAKARLRKESLRYRLFGVICD